MPAFDEHRKRRIIYNDDYVVEARKSTMRPGFNELALWCSADIGETSPPVIVHEVLVETKY